MKMKGEDDTWSYMGLRSLLSWVSFTILRERTTWPLDATKQLGLGPSQQLHVHLSTLSDYTIM